MATYVTKTINSYKVTAKVINLDTMEVSSKSAIFGKEPTAKQLENTFTKDGFKFIVTESTEKIEDYRRIPTATFMQFAHKLQPGESKMNLVTRTISTYKTKVICYNLETNQLETVTMNCEVTDVKKCDLVGKVAVKVESVEKTDTLYAVDIDTFIKYSEHIEK